MPRIVYPNPDFLLAQKSPEALEQWFNSHFLPGETEVIIAGVVHLHRAQNMVDGTWLFRMYPTDAVDPLPPPADHH